VLARNPGGLGSMPGIESWPVEQHNIARYVFLHPAARDLFVGWDTVVSGCVARLRALAGVEPNALDLTELVDELLAKSPDFADLWQRYEVRPYSAAAKTLNHPEVGTFTLNVQSMRIEGTPPPGDLPRRAGHTRPRRHGPPRPDRTRQDTATQLTTTG
jgi:hypothetical protein